MDLLFLLGFAALTHAGPLMMASDEGQNTSVGRSFQVCIFDSVVYEDNDPVTIASRSCEQCVCRPPGFACTPVRCPGNPAGGSCKAVQVPGQCCPQYQCDCSVNGRRYQNGEKIIDTHQNPCQICFCQGGEVICSPVRCYRRLDCQPVVLQGRCCPTYDHCPGYSPPQKYLNSPLNYALMPHFIRSAGLVQFPIKVPSKSAHSDVTSAPDSNYDITESAPQRNGDVTEDSDAIDEFSAVSDSYLNDSGSDSQESDSSTIYPAAKSYEEAYEEGTEMITSANPDSDEYGTEQPESQVSGTVNNPAADSDPGKTNDDRDAQTESVHLAGINTFSEHDQATETSFISLYSP